MEYQKFRMHAWDYKEISELLPFEIKKKKQCYIQIKNNNVITCGLRAIMIYLVHTITYVVVTVPRH